MGKYNGRYIRITFTVKKNVPLFIIVKKNVNMGPRYLKFLDFWVEHKDFKIFVKNAWEEEVNSNSMGRLHQKIKNTYKKLREWSRQAFADIYEELWRLEQKITNLENI